MQKSEYYNIFSNEETHFYYTSIQDTVLSFIKKYKKKKISKILDAGCGTGALAKVLTKLGEVYAVDKSQTAIKLAKKRELKNLKIGSVSNLPYQTNTFDVVTCIDVIYHKAVPSDIKAIQEMYRVLKPEGILVLKVPAHNWLKGHHDKVVFTRHRYELPEIKKILVNTKFKIIKLSYSYTILFPIILIKRFFDKFSKVKADSEINSINPVLNNILKKIMDFEKRILLEKNLPFGLFIYVVATKPKMDIHKKTRKS